MCMLHINTQCMVSVNTNRLCSKIVWSILTINFTKIKPQGVCDAGRHCRPPSSLPIAIQPSLSLSLTAAITLPHLWMVGCCLLFCRTSVRSRCPLPCRPCRPPVMRLSNRPPEGKAWCSRLTYSQRLSQHSFGAMQAKSWCATHDGK